MKIRFIFSTTRNYYLVGQTSFISAVKVKCVLTTGRVHFVKMSAGENAVWSSGINRKGKYKSKFERPRHRWPILVSRSSHKQHNESSNDRQTSVPCRRLPACVTKSNPNKWHNLFQFFFDFRVSIDLTWLDSVCVHLNVVNRKTKRIKFDLIDERTRKCYASCCPMDAFHIPLLYFSSFLTLRPSWQWIKTNKNKQEYHAVRCTK